MIVRRVLDDAHASIGLVHAVRAVDDIAVSHLMLGLYVAGMRIVHAIIEGVSWMRLQSAQMLVTRVIMRVCDELAANIHTEAGAESFSYLTYYIPLLFY